MFGLLCILFLISILLLREKSGMWGIWGYGEQIDWVRGVAVLWEQVILLLI